MAVRLGKNRRVLWGLFLAVPVFGFTALVVAWTGMFDVSAHRGHYPLVEPFVRLVMENSVAARAWDIDVPPLDDEALISLGAAHFRSGCAPCHGEPGKPRNPVVKEMLPQPPRLEQPVGFDAAELFWIVRNGLKYTGMPAWRAYDRPEEIWPVVAYLEYIQAPGTNTSTPAGQPGEPFAFEAETEPDGTPAVIVRCASCHGYDGSGNGTDLVPRLDILSEQAIAKALSDYASGARPSGIMELQATGLNERDIAMLARSFSRTGVPERLAVPDDDLGRGAELAAVGSRERKIPACDSCHDPRSGARPDYPSLIGQHAGYIANQIRLFQRGVRASTPAARMMATMVESLSAAEIEALAQHYKSGAGTGSKAETRPTAQR